MGISRRSFVAAATVTAAAAGLAPNAALAAARPDAAAGVGAARGTGRRAGTWLAGDTHVHTDHSSDGSTPRQLSDQRDPGDMPVQAQLSKAEENGADFLPLTDHRVYDQHWDPQWESKNMLLIPGEEVNGSPHAVVLGAVDTVVDGANPAGSAEFRHFQQSIWEAQAQHAVWQTAHPDDGEYTRADGPSANASAQGVNTVEIWNASSDPDVEIEYAENRWNAGFRFAAVGAGDSHHRPLWETQAPGNPTTWVFAADRSVRAILDALRAGHTTVGRHKSGPFLTIEADVNGDGRFEAMGGDEVIVRQRHLHRRAALRVRVQSGKGARVLVYATPGRSAGPLAEFTAASDDETYDVPLAFPAGVERHAWFRAEVRQPGQLSGREADPTLPDQLYAATTPVFVSVGSAAEPEPEIPLPAAERGADGAQLVIGEQGAFAGFADVAVADGTRHVVAEVHDDHRTTVVYRRVEERGHPAKAVVLSGDSGTARFPRIAASGKDVWVVWQDERGHEQPHRPTILLRHSSNGGKTFGKAQQLSDGRGRAEHPALAVLNGRHPLVAWADNAGGGAFDVLAQVVGVDRRPVNLSAQGKVTDPGDPDADARSPRWPASLFPAVAADGDGRAVVIWQDDRYDPDPLWTGHTPPPGEEASGGTSPDNWQILARTLPSPGADWTELVKVSKATDAASVHPAIAVDGDGGFVVAWETKALSQSGVNLSLRSARSGDAGATWSDPEPVALDPVAMSQRPSLSADPDGAVRVVWYDSRSVDWRWKVFTARLDAGSGWSAAERLTVPGNNTWPAIDGGTVVFTTDRSATRIQRDSTHEIHLIQAG
ncbi:hypothetical protein GCM10023317_05340 [Actinopolymorpha pittospori]|nr:CehA/McbA family metallohydrolase [Actinopolymorpha pittospori]